MSDHEVRDLQYRLKQAHKQVGKQGETIHRLRCEIAELLLLTDPKERAMMRAWMDGEDRDGLVAEITRLDRLLDKQQDYIGSLQRSHAKAGI
jgi:hypothetical protein